MEVGYWVGVGGASIPGEERLTEKERNGVTERSGLRGEGEGEKKSGSRWKAGTGGGTALNN